MLEEISTTQLLEWLQFMQLEPFGFNVENYRSGIIASSIYNVNRSKTTDKVFEPKDFFEMKESEKEFDYENWLAVLEPFAENKINGT